MLAQDTLRESEERFRLIANSAPVPIWVTKLDRTRSFLNQAYLDFLGLPFEEAIVFDWRKMLHPDDLPHFLQELAAGEASLKPFTLETSHQYQGLLNQHGDLLYANKTALAGIRSNASDVIGKPFWETPWFSGTEGMRNAVRDAFMAVMRGEEAQIEMRLCLPIGERY